MSGPLWLTTPALPTSVSMKTVIVFIPLEDHAGTRTRKALAILAKSRRVGAWGLLTLPLALEPHGVVQDVQAGPLAWSWEVLEGTNIHSKDKVTMPRPSLFYNLIKSLLTLHQLLCKAEDCG